MRMRNFALGARARASKNCCFFVAAHIVARELSSRAGERDIVSNRRKFRAIRSHLIPSVRCVVEKVKP